ncbi:phage terminase large subunit [Algisphaera agarilytica]|uniref:Putative phage terminase large subunit-like protein n=1 Tax=Algisphaera agarilytica TaxID=1385975 RepID=A0A7X0H4T8_9BACT|nr:phage terminase large subunit [Algisphaera agarilytica]MBB6429103.1 putative phage terminase large subunit-like protein [Algisphaera agarilytica]
MSLAYVLWCLLYRKEAFILIISATSEQAKQLLQDLTRELRGNTRLIQDFPEICIPLIQGRQAKPSTNTPGSLSELSGGGAVKVRAHHLVLPNDTCVRVLGAGQGLRGMKHRQHRPSLIIADDLEELEPTLSDDQRRKAMDWFQKTLLKAGDPQTNVVVIGTILHYDSLLANLTRETPQRGKAGGWDGKVYRAVEKFSERHDLWDQWEAIRFGEDDFEDKSGPGASNAFFKANEEDMLTGTKVLWPEVESYERLMQIRADEGRTSFQSEKQNEPLDPEECLFKEENLRFWDTPAPGIISVTTPGNSNATSGGLTAGGEAELIRKLGSRAQFYGACDPSLGQRGRKGDYSAVITLVRDSSTKVMYVIGADIARRSPDQLVEHIARLSRTYTYRDFAMETNLHKGLLVDQIINRTRVGGRSLRVKKVENTQNKGVRISSLEPLIAQGQLRFSRRQQMLLEQLRHFPLGAHDDGPDALEMAVRIAQTSKSYTSVSQF